MATVHAVTLAARRRLVPIVITSTTTIGGLLSLAVGLGGKSLLWGPVAAAIVWGLAFSTVLTLYVVPLLYLIFMRRRGASRQRVEAAGRSALQ
jgi:multidrug efflux pump subunit AcrB